MVLIRIIGKSKEVFPLLKLMLEEAGDKTFADIIRKGKTRDGV